MTRAEAWRRLQRLFGKRAAYRVNKAISSPEKRAAAIEQANQLRDDIAALKAKHAELYAAAGLKDLDKQIDELAQRRHRLSAEGDYHKFIVGSVDMGMFFIQAQGDTWEDCFAQLDAKKVDREKAKAK